MRKALIGIERLVRGWGGAVSFGILEQVLLSGSSFVFTAVVARNLPTAGFGWFSIAWSMMMLMEVGAWGLFGDAVPSTAEKIRRSLWPEFRWSFLALSAAFSALVLSINLFVAFGIGFYNPELAVLLVAMGAAFVAWRFQNAVRRLYYLDGMRKEAALAAIVNVGVLFFTTFAMVYTQTSSPTIAFICMASANAASACCFIFQNVVVRRPDRRMLVWSASRLWRTGRWLLISSEISWLGNYGVVVFIGTILGVNSSGTLRAILMLNAPMGQLTNVMLSIIIPKVAAALRRDRTISWWRLATKTMLLLGLANGLYALIVTVFGEVLLPHLFGDSATGVTWVPIALATFGYAFESVRYGCNVVLFASGRTRILTVSQTVALLSSAIAIPLAAFYFGLTGVVGAMAMANNIGTLIVVAYFFYVVRYDQLKRREATKSVEARKRLDAGAVL